ncbi:hypothetical protein B296_00054279 [Ensete ventricosum]|uniref:Sugar phosphate transporter domain-containing protein n=1 Tax=Ensete ventricosum TaxID=4639 RepID=A0A426Y4U1_ENSVE|nr:hypothetical protein B296_00054279 [Ensete ventricosum]
MAPASKADRKAALDVAAWMFNIVTSVGIIMINKALMATHHFTFGSIAFFIVLSCTIAVGTNLSQFICIGRFTAVSFQVLGHMKTVLVLTLGFFLFGREGLNLHVISGMILAVLGMMWYGNASSKPGGKERRTYSLPVDKSQKHGLLSEAGDHDDKV